MSPCSFCSAPNVDEASACRACGAPLQARDTDTALPVGARLQNGAFQIERVLGRGGFGVTYQARDLMLERVVAVKEFFPQQAARQGAMVLPGALRPEEYRVSRAKFLEEARMLARFKHPGIVDVYSVFEENNSVYMTMEFARGKTLGQLLQARNTPMDEGEAVGYIRQVAEALAVVHDAGLLHRDIKPENVVVDMSRVLLIDFGTAGEQAEGLSESRRPIIVTPGYAPLEQYAQSARRGPFTDVYALGATLYHLLSGQAPPPAPDLAKGVEIKPLQELNSAVSHRVAETVHAALQTEVARRPQTVRAFLSGLDGSISFAPDIQADDDMLGADVLGDNDYDLLNRRAKAIQDLARGHREALGYLPPLTPKAATPHTALPVARVPNAPQAPVAAPNSSSTQPVSSGIATRSRTDMRPVVAVVAVVGLAVVRMMGTSERSHYTTRPNYSYDNNRPRHWINGHEVFPGNPEYNTFDVERNGSRLTTRQMPNAFAPGVRIFNSIPVIKGVKNSMGRVVFSRNGALLAQNIFNARQQESEKVEVSDARTGKVQHVLDTKSTSSLKELLFSPDAAILAVVGFDGNIGLYDVRTGALKRTLHRPDQDQTTQHAMSFSTNGRQFMSNAGTRIFVWDVRSGGLLRQIKLPFDENRTSQNDFEMFSPDGRTWISGDASGEIRWCDIENGRSSSTRPFLGSEVPDLDLDGLVFSPDGSRAAGKDATTIRILRVQKQVAFQTTEVETTQNEAVELLCFSPDNRLLIGHRRAGDLHMCVWDAQNGALLQTFLPVHSDKSGSPIPGSIYAATFTPDGQTLRVIGNNRALIEWKRIAQPKKLAPESRRAVPEVEVHRIKPAATPPVQVQFAGARPSLSKMRFSENAPAVLDMPGLDAKTQVLKRYNAWKAAHAESNAETLLQFYAPDAETTSGNMADLRRYLEQNEGHNWQSVQDLQIPKWWFRADGKQVVLDVFLRYLNGWGVAESAGMRRLFWQKRDGQWLIVRDRSDAVIGSTPVS